MDFKSLWRLLFVHGRWSYIRITEMILYFLYKNIVFAFPQFLFCFYNAWSGQTVFDDFYITFYNLVFTAWPVLVRAILDQDIYFKKWTQREVVLQTRRKELFVLDVVKKFYPYLYYVGQKDTIFKFP